MDKYQFTISFETEIYFPFLETMCLCGKVEVLIMKLFSN